MGRLMVFIILGGLFAWPAARGRAVVRRDSPAARPEVVGLTESSAGPEGREELLLSDINLGKDLQAGVSIRLLNPAPQNGLQITVASDNPQRLLFSPRPDATGSASITLRVLPGFRVSPEFWAQAFDDKGSETYTASVPGYGRWKSVVSFYPSGFIILGPLRAPVFRTTTGATPSRIRIYSVRLNSALDFVEEQALAAGLRATVKVESSDPAVGAIVSPVGVRGGSSMAVAEFKPAKVGQTILSAPGPTGFSSPAKMTSVTALVSKPGMAVTSLISLGHNLQVRGVVSFGEAAPAGGARITLTSSHPELMVLSANAKQPGRKSITIPVAGGEGSATFFLQALGSSGAVSYSATSPGYSSGTGTIILTPSGVLITPAVYGPPDEAALARKEAADASPGMILDRSRHRSVLLALWTAQLDPGTRRGADITVQALRPGLSITVVVRSNNRRVGTVVSPVKIAGGSDHTFTRFLPSGTGSTMISISTPRGFATPSNATSVPIKVNE